MLPVGRMGGGDRGGSKKSPVKDVWRSTLSGLSSEEFNKAWITLKEAHDKELSTLQGQLRTLRRQQVADRRRADTHARVQELTRQQQVLNDTIDTLRMQLSTRTCDRCSNNEESKRSLQQKLYAIQQQNLTIIADLTKERNKLREENKRLSAKLNANSNWCHFSESDSDDDFIFAARKPRMVYRVRDPPSQLQINLLQNPLAELPAQTPAEPQAPAQNDLSKSPVSPGQQPGSELSTPLSQDISVVPETSFEKISSGSGMSSVISLKGPLPRKNLFQVPLAYSSLPEDKTDLPVTNCDTTSVQMEPQTHDHEFRFTCSFSASSSEESEKSYLLSETSEERMPDYIGPGESPSMTKEKFPLDCTLKASRKRSLPGPAQNDTTIGAKVARTAQNVTSLTTKDASTQKDNNEPPALNQDTEPKAVDTGSSSVGTSLKRKGKTRK